MELAVKTLENLPRTEFTFRQNFGYRFFVAAFPLASPLLVR
jgi:hypothetical protein